jgi:hypothetical protein
LAATATGLELSWSASDVRGRLKLARMACAAWPMICWLLARALSSGGGW